MTIAATATAMVASGVIGYKLVFELFQCKESYSTGAT